VQALLAAGYQVYAINPMSVARYRQRHSTSGAKSDAGDAHVLAEITPPSATLPIPPTPLSVNRLRHRRTVSESTPTRRAISWLGTPSAANSNPEPESPLDVAAPSTSPSGPAQLAAHR
jgi:hypothetical protein